MGTDYVRMKPLPGVDRAQLEGLARAQALSFQSMPYYWSRGWASLPELPAALGRVLHEEACFRATNELCDWLELPEWDEDAEACRDRPDLAYSWRVSVISNRAAFPPLWRVQALRTILPWELGAQLQQWTDWIDQVRAGLWRGYLLELFVYERAQSLQYQWGLLHDVAVASFEATNAWTRRPKFVAARQQVLELPRPRLPEVGVTPPQADELRPEIELLNQELDTELERMVEATGDWDRCVRGSWKLGPWAPYLEGEEDHAFEAFVGLADEPWLGEFFDWAERVRAEGMGLSLSF